ALGVMLAGLCVVTVAAALGLVFDPRYKDFLFAPLTAAVAPYLVLGLVGFAGNRLERKQIARPGVAEAAFAAVLALCAIAIVVNEGFANWQAVWFAAGLVGLAVSLMLVRDAPDSA